MQDPTQSPLFTAAFFGNGVGEPTIGPFRNWRTINPATVFTRNYGNGPLYSYAGVDAITNRTRNSQILIPTAEPDSNFELQHGGPHVFIGGSMNRLDDAVRDPIFYSHHAFVDQIWERFRFNQFVNNVNPATDYPFIEGDPRFRPEHRPNATMGFFPNNELNIDYQNIVGYSNIFFSLVQYEQVPECPACGNSVYLFCNPSTNRCASRSVAQIGRQNLQAVVRKKRQASLAEQGCARRSLINDFDFKKLWGTPELPMQQSMSMQRSQMSMSPNVPMPMAQNDWVYIPVKIVSKRPSEYTAFKYYSIDDAFRSTNQLGLKGSLLHKASQRAYDSCEKSQDAANKIKIVSHGLNYDGYGEEYAVVDNRLGISVSYGFVPVKRPGTGKSEAMISAFDSCGRVCRPYCRTGGTNDMNFHGGIQVTADQPLQYGNSYAEATLNAWSVPSQNACPTLDYSNIPISFFCDYSDSWIWSSSSGTAMPFGQSGNGNMGTGRGFASRRGSPRRGRPFSQAAVVPFHGSSQLHSLVPSVLMDYSLNRQQQRNTKG